MSTFVHRYIVVLALAVGAFWPAAAHAQAKLGFVDLQKVIEGCKEGKDAQTKLNEVKAKKETQFKSRQEDFQKMVKDYEAQQTVLSVEAGQEKRIQIQRTQSELELALQAAQAELELERNKMIKPLIERIKTTIDDIGKSEGYSMIMQTNGGILYSADALDLTNDIIARLNGKKS